MTRPPELELKNAKGLSNESLQTLQTELTKLAKAQCGEVSICTTPPPPAALAEKSASPSPAFPPQVMIYELADHVLGFLSENNKPPSRSFHEEMLKNQRRQQEKRAQEEQLRMDQQRKRAEETVRRERGSRDTQLCLYQSRR